MSEWQNINLNDQIRCKLTPLGEKVWRDFWAPYDRGRDSLDMLPACDDGWREVQLWRFASVFGPHMENGAKLVVETTVQVRTGATEWERI